MPAGEQGLAITGTGLHGRRLGWRNGIGVEDALSDPDISSGLRAMMVITYHLGRRFPDLRDV